VKALGHEEAQERFDAYYEGELPPEERLALEEHLRGCEACRKDYEKLVATLAALSKMRTSRAPRRFLPSLKDQIRRRSRGRFFGPESGLLSRLPYEVLSVVMLVALLAIFAYVFFGRGGSAIGH